VEADYDRFREGLPPDLRAYCLEAYGVDIQGEYAGAPVANPFGKASGQLSLDARQVRRDAEAGLGFVVLKTVIAQDERGAQQMQDWAIAETRMRVEPISGTGGEPGWTVTWKGRGWYESFESYLRFFGEAVEIGAERGVRIAPSVKYHLPAPGEGEFSEGEYRYTTGRLLEVWQARQHGPMPLEKDFSPTLAGDARSREREQILTWLRRVPELIYRASGQWSEARGRWSEEGLGDWENREARSDAAVSASLIPHSAIRTPHSEQSHPPSAPLTLGVKLMNARSDLAFQVEMARVLLDEAVRPPGFLVYANRLFDPEREFEGRKGVAYGGPDLSRRNLQGLRQVLMASHRGEIRSRVPPISGTGDILTGKMAVEYGLLGASSCQMHTVFQLPASELGGAARNRSATALHHLALHPESGLVPWLLHLQEERGERVDWRDLPRIGRELLTRREAQAGG
jgi:hypothetical protein